MLTKTEAAQKLLALDDVLILCHRNPDGDTLGSGFALARALLNKGRRARVFCHDAVPEKFAYMVPEMPDFEPKTVISVDVADFALFGERTEAQIARYGPTALAIDHHPSHRPFAEELYLEGDSASCCEIIWGLLKERKDEWQLDAAIASCLYTGVATDTGCFKFSNTSPRTHRTAAELMELGADYVSINKVMFDTKTFEDLKLERLALDRLWMSADGKIAVMTITKELMDEAGVDETGLDAITALPRKIEGVEVGITLKQRGESEFKISVRTGETTSASDICAHFGGGGHARAAGCQFEGLSPEEIREKMVKAAYGEMGRG